MKVFKLAFLLSLIASVALAQTATYLQGSPSPGALAVPNMVPSTDSLGRAALTPQLPLARGGLNLDLSATGGTNRFIRQNTAGGIPDVVQPSSASLSDTTVPTACTPTDQSGAALTFTSVSCEYWIVGNSVYVAAGFTYPTTANGSAAIISIPVAVPNQAYVVVPAIVICGCATANVMIVTVQNTSTAAFKTTANANVTNANLSAQFVRFMLIYPVS